MNKKNLSFADVAADVARMKTVVPRDDICVTCNTVYMCARV